MLAFDPDDGRIVRVSIPFWIVRMKMRGATIDLNGNHMNLEDLKLTAEDLERFGPTLIVDHKDTKGERVLVSFSAFFASLRFSSVCGLVLASPRGGSAPLRSRFI